MRRTIVGLLPSLGLFACGDKADSGATANATASASNGDDDSDGDGDGDDSDGDADDDDDSASDSSTPAESSEGDATTDEPDDSGPVTAGFINDPDGGGASVECDLWAQDCPRDEKCMPWSNDGSSAWNAARCSTLDPDPAQPGDVCAVEGSGVSGIDNCDLGAMCWDVDPETNQGVCVPFCMGSEANPICEDPSTTCTIANDGVLILCLPVCDPLLQDCTDGQACYPIDDTFVCAPDTGGEMGAFGEACGFINVCDPGLFCSNPDLVPGCNSNGCCSAFCDLANPDASATCPGAGGGQECTPWFAEGMAPPGLENIGGCAIPT
jgi:hypothetical protein